MARSRSGSRAGTRTGSRVSRRATSRMSTTSGSSAGANHPVATFKIGGRFRLLQRLGQGAFGEVYSAKDLHTGDIVAMKLESIEHARVSRLAYEGKLYSYLNKVLTVGVPKFYWYGREGDFNILAIEFLGPSLEHLLEYCDRKFDLKTVLMLTDQLLCRLEFLHTMGYLHRDLKPDNFVMGRGKKSHHVYVIDFGLSKRYRSKAGIHCLPAVNCGMCGTARYVSIPCHMGLQQGRRDDMESLSYVITYLARNGNLPWMKVKGKNKLDKYDGIKQKKMSTPIHEICQGLPPCFAWFMQYTRSLKFDETPNYFACRVWFSDALRAMNQTYDYEYTWTSKSIRKMAFRHTRVKDSDERVSFRSSQLDAWSSGS